MKHETMQIKFEGQNNQIDANTLINILIHYNTIISAANAEYGDGAHNISVKINALEKGSFIIDIGLQEAIGSIFSEKTILYLSGIVTVVAGIFDTYKFLKGKPKDENDELNIKVNGNNNIINQTITKVYNQPLVREAISKSIETANNDVNVEGISIMGKNIDTIMFERELFSDLIYNDFDKENIPDERKDLINGAVLTITKLSFEKGGQWQFLFKGFKIGMTVKDDALMQIINKGERFGKGDAIKVDLQINQKYNFEYQGYENKSYKIVAFYEHILAPKQTKLET